ncbi:MAG: Malate permease [uncultured Sulfurovum sp.]|uniref:Malate permease n=1 Tax=uncultured Sulfurovum sp. TaxID=269237 RepID=A0A6S6SEK4_9BACT|nr:MAG: Malate permease [uncultured Sulfurovum sp.]
MINFILILVYVLIGYSIKNLSVVPANLAHYLNKFVIYLSLPAMILLQIPKLDFTSGALVPVAVSWSVMGLSALLVFFVSKYLAFSKEITGSLMLVAVLTNSSFLGIPVITAYFGDAALPYIVIYDQLGTFLALATYGTVIAAYYSAKSAVSLKIILYKIVVFPPFVTLVVAMFLRDVTFLPVMNDIFTFLAATIVPFALVAVGLQMQFKLPKEEVKAFTFALLVKLIFAPVVALVMCTLFGWEGLSAQVSIMEAGMSSMITAAAMASFVGLAPRLSNAIVGYGIVLSFMSTFILYQIIT